MIFDRELPEFAGQSVDQKLVLLAKNLEGKVVTNDYNLNKVAKLHNVGVINLNDIANSLKPVFLPGESLDRWKFQAFNNEAASGLKIIDPGTTELKENDIVPRDQVRFHPRGRHVPVLVGRTPRSRAPKST